MSPYARGNRDGLLAFAAHCDERAEAWRRIIREFALKGSPVAARLRASSHWKLDVWKQAAADARRAAEAVPEPETVESREK